MKVLPHCGINVIGMTGEVLPLYLEDVRTITFAGDHSGLIYGNGWGPNTLDGRNNYYATSDSASVEFEAKGTSLAMQIYSGDANAKIYVDGVLTNSIASVAAWQTVTVTLGGDTWHRVKLIASSATFTTSTDRTSTSMAITGSAPAIRKPTAATGIDLSGTLYNADATGVQLDGSVALNSFFSAYTIAASALQDGRYRFKIVPDGSGLPMSVAFRAYPWGNTGFRCTVDGVEDGTLGSHDAIQSYPANSGVNRGFPWLQLLSAVPAGATREIGVWLSERTAAAPSLHDNFIVVNGTLSGTAPTAAKKIAVFGDSISAGDSGITCDQGYLHKLCLLKDAPSGRAPLNYAVDGSDVSAISHANVDAAALLLVGSGDVFIMAFGANDVIGGDSAATFQSQLTTELNYMISKTAKQIYVIQYTEANSAGGVEATAMNTNRVAYKAAYQAAIAACTTPAQCTFISTDGLLNTSTDLQGDGVHPRESGMVKLAAAYAVAIT